LGIDDAYAELGVAPGAGDAQVKAAWRRLVSQWHPDRNASAEAAALMQRINGAYERIRLATAGVAVGAVDVDADVGADDDAASADEPRRTGRIVRRRIRLTLEEAALGCTRLLRGRVVDACSACDGSGRLPRPVRCAACDGAGHRRGSWWLVWPAPEVACAACEGTGSLRPECPACEGAGRQATRYRRTVRLPAGVRHGDRLHAAGGGRHRGGFDGTLELRVEVAPHPFFTVGDDGVLRCECPVDGYAWLAEAWIDVPTPGGLQQMRLRRGREVYRLRGQGLPLRRGSTERGDYFVTVVPTFADTPDAEQQALLERLAALGDATPPPAIGAWRRRLRAWQNGRR
jgi:molecular chaperone DnaJ